MNYSFILKKHYGNIDFYPPSRIRKDGIIITLNFTD